MAQLLTTSIKSPKSSLFSIFWLISLVCSSSLSYAQSTTSVKDQTHSLTASSSKMTSFDQQNLQITLATDHWQPFYGPDLKDGGYMIEVCKAAFKAVGYQLTVKLMPWKRAVAAANRGIYDGLLGAYYTEKRALIYHYSEAIGQEETVLIALSKRKLAFNNISDLHNYTIGVMRGAVNSTQLDEAKNLRFSYSNDATHNLRKLISARVDFIITGKAHLQYLLNQQYKLNPPQLDVLKPSLKTNKIHITISKTRKDSQQIVENFDKGIQIIKANGIYKKIRDKHFNH